VTNTEDWATLTVADVVRRYPGALPVLHRYGIDACCGGAHALGFVAERHALSLDALIEELQDAGVGHD
jgi:regulator of cell morphogenesis and NO signaling